MILYNIRWYYSEVVADYKVNTTVSIIFIFLGEAQYNRRSRNKKATRKVI